MTGWQVCHVTERYYVYLDGVQVQHRVTRLAILVAVRKASSSVPATGWIRRLNGVWEFDKEGPFKTLK